MHSIATQLNADSDIPVFKEGAAVVFKYKAVTSGSENKLQVFSRFPHLPQINLTEFSSIVAKKAHSSTLARLKTVKKYWTAASEDATELIIIRFDEQMAILEK